MKWGALLLAALGVAFIAYLVVHVGAGAILAALKAVGWQGFVLLCGLTLVLFTILAAAWQAAAPGWPARRFGAFAWGRMVRDSASEVLPFSALGGVAIGTRAVILGGVPGQLATASTVVDITTELAAQLAFTSLGVALLARQLSQGSAHHDLVGPAVVGLVVGAVAIGGLVLAQRRGLGLAERLAARWLPGMAADAAEVHRLIGLVYRKPLRVLASFLLHLAGWFFAAFCSWVALRLLGAPMDYADVVAVESLVYVIRGAAFVAPNGLGVQEGAYTLLGPVFGLPPDMGLALSLTKRARDISIGVPALLVWQAIEAGRLFKPKP